MMIESIKMIIDAVVNSFLGMTLAEMGINYTVSQHNSLITITLQAGFSLDYLMPYLQNDLNLAIKKSYADQQIIINYRTAIGMHKTQLPGSALRGVKNTIAIASGKGGVGKSTVTVNIAIALAKAGAKVGILDADIYGPSMPLMLGSHAAPEISGDHYLPIAAHGIVAMSMGYLTQSNQALIWRGPMLAKSLIQMLDITLWQDLDYLLIDLPPGTGDIQLSLVQKIPLTAAIIVTTPQTVATLDAQKAITMFKTTGIHILGLVENMATHTCSHCGHQDALFGHGGGHTLAQAHHLPLLGQLPLASQIGSDCDQGCPTASYDDDPLSTLFMTIALLSAIKLAKIPFSTDNKFPPIVMA